MSIMPIIQPVRLLFAVEKGSLWRISLDEIFRHFARTRAFRKKGWAIFLEFPRRRYPAWEDVKSLPRKVNASEFFEAFPELSHDDIFSEECGYACKTLKRARGLDVVQVPFYGAIAAGTPIEMIDVDETMPIPGHIYNAYPDSFLLRVSGESMNRCIPNGCIALIDPDAEWVSGKIYAVRVGGTDATVKIVNFYKSSKELVPNSYDPRFKKKKYSAAEDGDDSVRILGRVVWFFAPFNFGK